MVLYGGGGHAKVVFDCLLATDVALEGVFDNQILTGFLADKYRGKYESEILPKMHLIISIGNNKIRKKISTQVSHHFGTIMHPSAPVSQFSTIGMGSVVFHQAVIQSHASIGKHCIVNTAAVVEHDCVIGDFAHLATHATLCGGAYVGEGTLIGAGAIVLPNIKIGKWCVVGAGSVVTKDLSDFSIVAGVPARLL